jgi:D-Tyr-tRNAtyr deacylase
MYVGFIIDDVAASDEEKLESRFSKIIKGLMNAKLATFSGWKTDHSDACSVCELARTSPCNIIIVPQATLAGKLKCGDKYLKYHRQIGRDRSRELYEALVEEVIKFFSKDAPQSRANLHDCGNVKVIRGTFGGRQGFEFSSTGPSTHSFQY